MKSSKLVSSQRAFRYYIYGLRDPRDLKIRYIGCSHQLQSRYRAHCNILRKKPTNKKEAWVLELRSLGLKPILETLDSCCYEYVFDLERHYFDLYHDDLYQKVPSSIKYYKSKEFVKDNDLPILQYDLLLKNKITISKKPHVDYRKKLKLKT